ncbi:MAG: YceH family protein [Chitinispirillaceae bacterium]|nr:YceH family protein [Chitinispirillaceae bacterium]
MELNLDSVAVRVLGALIEKEATTPDYYPLSLNALVNACNQRSNREPVMHLADDEVVAAIDALKEKRLVWQRSVAGARVFKYEHNVRSLFPLTEQETGVLCVLMLRGPQTVGEIRLRTDRLCSFASLDETGKVIRGLISREDGPFILELPRQPGRKEPRFVHLLSGEEWAAGQDAGSVLQNGPTVSDTGSSLSDRVMALEAAIAALHGEVGVLKEEFEAFKRMLE